MALDPKDPLAKLAADANAALGDVPKDQYAGRFANEAPVVGVERIEARQGPIRAMVNLGFGMSQGGRACEKADSRQGEGGR
jgi:hypothetical protein